MKKALSTMLPDNVILSAFAFVVVILFAVISVINKSPVVVSSSDVMVPDATILEDDKVPDEISPARQG